MNQQIKQQFEEVKKVSVDNLEAISSLFKTARSLADLAKKIDDKQARKQLEKKADAISVAATDLYKQNNEMYYSYKDLAETAINKI